MQQRNRFYLELPTTVLYGGKAYKLRPAWPNILTALEVLDDRSLPDVMKIGAAIDLVIASPHPADAGLLEAAFSELNPGGKNNDKKVIDFRQDWGYIFAGILQAYGIDLYNAPRLHWTQLVKMLQSIPDCTKIAEIIKIRQMDIPKPTKYNAEERARLSRLKAQFAIKPAQSDLAEGLNSLFNVLAAQAKQK